MIHVFDTSAFVVLTHFYPETFESLWKGLDELVDSGRLVSTREVFNELERYNESIHVLEWAKARKSLFPIPTEEELAFASELLAIPRFQALIGERALLKGTPVADPFVIAAAAVRGGTVVTQERRKPNAAKIPNVCEHFGIRCIDLQAFMKGQGWKF